MKGIFLESQSYNSAIQELSDAEVVDIWSRMLQLILQFLVVATGFPFSDVIEVGQRKSNGGAGGT